MNKKNIKLDAHFHLDLYKNYQQVLDTISNQDVYILAVTNTPSVFHFTKRLSKEYTNILPAIGLHPELARERHSELNLLLDKIPSERYIGEIGLDYSPQFSMKDRKLQRGVFEAVMHKCSEVGDRIISIHSRRADSDVINIVGERFPGTVILHWYSGQMGNLNKALDSGFYFSVNTAMIKSQSGQKIISRIPKSRILTETDGPFIEVNNQSVEPDNILDVVAYLSGIWQKEIQETYSIIADNIIAANILPDRTI